MANIKLSKEELSKRAAEANAQNSDFLSALDNLGSESYEAPEDNKAVTYKEPIDDSEDIPVIKTKKVNKTVTSQKSDKPGYVSLVIPTNLKKKWKTYCSAHGISLTDCIKISMKLLEDMEKKEAVSLEDGVISYIG